MAPFVRKNIKYPHPCFSCEEYVEDIKHCKGCDTIYCLYCECNCGKYIICNHCSIIMERNEYALCPDCNRYVCEDCEEAKCIECGYYGCYEYEKVSCVGCGEVICESCINGGLFLRCDECDDYLCKSCDFCTTCNYNPDEYDF